MKTTLHVTGMHCEGCENKIQKVVGRLENVSSVKADRNNESVELEYTSDTGDLLGSVKSKIDDLGYTVTE